MLKFILIYVCIRVVYFSLHTFRYLNTRSTNPKKIQLTLLVIQYSSIFYLNGYNIDIYYSFGV